MENFAIEKEFLNTFARHYQTHEPLPEELVKRIIDAANFNVAYACLRPSQLRIAGYGMVYTSYRIRRRCPCIRKRAWKRAQILPQIAGTCMSVQFGHIMSGAMPPDIIVINGQKCWTLMLFLYSRKKAFSIPKWHNRSATISCRKEELSIRWYCTSASEGKSCIDALLKRNGIIK